MRVECRDGALCACYGVVICHDFAEASVGELLSTPIPGTGIPVLLVVGLIGLWLLLRSKATELGSTSALNAMLGRGQPVVLQFFKNT